MFKREIKIYRRLARLSETPRAAKFCFGSVIGYLLLPFDWIPDFLPVSGHLDDALIVPALVALARRQYSRRTGRALPRVAALKSPTKAEKNLNSLSGFS